MNGKEFTDFIEYLSIKLREALPGQKAHLKMIPPVRIDEFVQHKRNGKRAAVLLLLYPFNNHVYTVLIRRQEYDGVHSGQIAFPGGKYSKTDGDLKTTALREAAEEVGIKTDEVIFLGCLTEFFIPPSRFLLTPFVAYTQTRPRFKAESSEVAEIIETDIREISDKNLKIKEITVHGGRKFLTPYYDIHNHVVWGATGMIFSEFSELIKDYLGFDVR